MEQTSVQKQARVLRVLVIITFVCNLILLVFVPLLAGFRDARYDEEFWLWAVDSVPFDFWLHLLAKSWNISIWVEGWTGANGIMDPSWVVLNVFLLFCAVCTAVILWQGKRVLDTILKGNPFVMDNAKSLIRAAVCCFLISGTALVRLIWGMAYYQNIAPLLTYNALFVPIFLMGGLLFMVMSALFRQAAELKAENDLTI